ncbi:hypothetical protein Cgig2_019708 [Carnegiea gigantea]|uniref:Uncharacterized protein n=1 Tax=Carnegiea gigantea TaxID=171969 RepID=A0A9Q1KMX3_9CARY|nr:hypothetical protein Cgig2_019708 [Carnegiea gigantea]
MVENRLPNCVKKSSTPHEFDNSLTLIDRELKKKKKGKKRIPHSSGPRSSPKKGIRCCQRFHRMLKKSISAMFTSYLQSKHLFHSLHSLNLGPGGLTVDAGKRLRYRRRTVDGTARWVWAPLLLAAVLRLPAFRLQFSALRLCSASLRLGGLGYRWSGWSGGRRLGGCERRCGWAWWLDSLGSGRDSTESTSFTFVLAFLSVSIHVSVVKLCSGCSYHDKQLRSLHLPARGLHQNCLWLLEVQHRRKQMFTKFGKLTVLFRSSVWWRPWRVSREDNL